MWKQKNDMERHAGVLIDTNESVTFVCQPCHYNAVINEDPIEFSGLGTNCVRKNEDMERHTWSADWHKQVMFI